MKVFKTDAMRVPVKSWAEDLDDKTLQQITNAAMIPAVFHHVALMPDAHMGYGVPIGAVVALKNAISPAQVGMDIACGVIAVQTYASDLCMETVKEIIGGIRQVIPVGFNHHKEMCDRELLPSIPWNSAVVEKQFDSARKQLGTLGGGNHFVEIQRGSDGYIWIMIHSGSRNIGYKVAKHYMKVTAKLNDQWFTSEGEVGGKWYPSRLTKNELAILPIGADEAGKYLTEMNWCLNFAKISRRRMMMRAAKVFADITGYGVNPDSGIDIHHNYVAIEHHFGQDVWVHRKGATLAWKSTKGIIPGSQGTKSYIVKGKGNPDSFCSCSHGAGRQMGRKQAKRELNLADEQAKMKDIVHSVRNQGDLDEAPGAYKDIGEVMKAQEDLVEIVVELTPLGVLKG